MEYKCKKCGKEIDSHDDIWNESRCDNCKMKKKQRILLIIIVLGLLGTFIGAFCGYIDYGYELRKCENLKSTQSNYDFNQRVEIDASYNEHCYYLNNHPFALIGTILRTGILMGVLVIVLGFVILMFWGGKIMSKCGIKKYDELPARIGLIDVDFLRAGLHMELKRIAKAQKKVEELSRSLDLAIEKEEEKK